MSNCYAIDRHRVELGMPVCSATSVGTQGAHAWLTVRVEKVPAFRVMSVVTPVLSVTDAVIADAKGAFPGRRAWSPPI